MKRREFLQLLGLGLAAYTTGQVAWPGETAAAAPPELRLAFLADAHLENGEAGQPAALSLARAVAEIRALKPAPRLVLFAGDLAHHGAPAALALGREILADLPAPCLMLMGEGDSLPDAAAPWRRRFGEPWFSQVLRQSVNGNQQSIIQILGLHTAWCPGPGGPLFRVGDSGRRWLARELARLDPEVPLLVLTHAPLAPIFRPWQQWTLDGQEVLARLQRFRQVLCLHGHTHNAGIRIQGPVSKDCELGGFFTAKGKLTTEDRLLRLSLPATAWPRPLAMQGTPAQLGPGLGPGGCGWALLTGEASAFSWHCQTWPA